MRTNKQKIGGYCESFINILPKINIKPFKEYCLTISNLDIRIRIKKIVLELEQVYLADWLVTFNTVARDKTQKSPICNIHLRLIFIQCHQAELLQ